MASRWAHGVYLLRIEGLGPEIAMILRRMDREGSERDR